MAAIGLRVKTGRAFAVALGGVAERCEPIAREEVVLADPADGATVHPYHLELDGDAPGAEAAAKRARRIGAKSLARLFESVGKVERIDAIAVVVNTHTPPERITSPHMRAHGKEGWLFREICERGAERIGIAPATLALAEVALTDRAIQRVVTSLGERFGKPWTADWKLACAAAWLQLR